ncbi:MAG TPA: enoyl-CoA hydratase/isomerase family protein, partial [Acidimicrobiales bacterium]|nr:enoyl-CoA hydratase/isomerase family protein [Acidimicrobiales bacterium]
MFAPPDCNKFYSAGAGAGTDAFTDAMIGAVELRELQLTEEGAVSVIRVPGGELTARTARELDDVLGQVGERRGPRVVLVEAGGADFCSEVAPDLDTVAAGVDPPGRMEALHIPVVVAISGHCVSAGLELALGADVRVASPGSRLQLAEVAAGGLSRWGGVQRLTRAAGVGLATAMVLLGREVDGATAHGAGLVHELADDPAARARAVSAELAERGPL